MNRILPPLAFSAIVAAMVLALASVQVSGGRRVDGVADIGVEHGAPVTLALAVSAGTEPGFLEASQKGEGAVRLSVPQEWGRREVRAAALADVTADSPSFGFVRWRLPERAVLSLTIPRSPAGIILHNPSKKPLSIRLKRVDLATGDVQTDVFLLTEDTLRLY
ncbi:MAG: hypothetical protein AAB728_03650 [Patescibacteria group bacterium]